MPFRTPAHGNTSGWAHLSDGTVREKNGVPDSCGLLAEAAMRGICAAAAMCTDATASVEHVVLTTASAARQQHIAAVCALMLAASATRKKEWLLLGICPNSSCKCVRSYRALRFYQSCAACCLAQGRRCTAAPQLTCALLHKQLHGVDS
jgi:hypothetical protein